MHLYPLPTEMPSVVEALEFGRIALKVLRGQSTPEEMWECAHFAWHLAGVGIKMKHEHKPQPYMTLGDVLEKKLAEFVNVPVGAATEEAKTVPWELLVTVALKVFEMWFNRKK